jgi:hypothetical protein
VTLVDLLGWTPETWTAIGTLALAVVTFLLVLTEPLRRWRECARLRLEIRKQPPDTHFIEMRNVQTGAYEYTALYVRARISHVRGRAGENAELVAANLSRVDERGREEPVSSFLPMSLKWSHVGGTTIRVPRRLFRHCDVGFFVKVAMRPSLCSRRSSSRTQSPAARSRTCFDRAATCSSSS